MAFKVPLDSSPPATPGRSRSLFSNVSTTPAGVPPSSAHSFTPQGPPPSTVAGSSGAGTRQNLKFGDSLFGKSGGMANDSIFMSSTASSARPPPRRKGNAAAKPFNASQSLLSSMGGSRFGQSSAFGHSKGFGESQWTEDMDEEVEEDEHMDDEMDEGMNAEYDEDERSANVSTQKENPRGSFSFLGAHRDFPQTGPSELGQRKSIYTNPGNAKRPKLDERWANQSPAAKSRYSPMKTSTIASIARELVSRSPCAEVTEHSDVIIGTEDEIYQMYDDMRRVDYDPSQIAVILSDVSQRLAGIWRESAARSGVAHLYGASPGIGPGDESPNFVKASLVGSLMLQLHHPPVSSAHAPNTSQQARLAPHALMHVRSSTFESVPKVLLKWINTNHASHSNGLVALRQVEPNATASSGFWNIVIAGTLRGQLQEVAETLQHADFNYARSALEDGLPQAGYRGAQLQNIQKCVNKARQLLESCPGVQNNDWEIQGEEWSMHRIRVDAALAELKDFAEGENSRPAEPIRAARFEAINFGLDSGAGRSDFSFTQSARIAESRVPWTIYQSLKSLYQILLGDRDTITAYAQDWVEAAFGLTVWWDGGNEHMDLAPANGDFNARSPGDVLRRFSRGTPAHGARLVDRVSEEAYLERLSLAFNYVTDQTREGSFRLNSLSGLEVALGSVCEGDVELVVRILQTWSLCVASAVIEIAEAGAWLGAGQASKPLSNMLSDEDLMVLSYGQDSPRPAIGLRKDDVLVTYADGLSSRALIEHASGVRSGWEVALEILSRLEDAERLQKAVSDILDRLPLDSPEQVDKVVMICSELGLDNQSRKVSERYGDLLASRSEEYGHLLVCYARAHNRRKVKTVVDLLISYSLVHSRAFPAETDLDEQLRELIRQPKSCLSSMAAVDEEAARILQFYLSGYATLRRFYEIRDEGVGLKQGERPQYQPMARRRAAAQALVAVIGSAADSIYGGLYDPDRDSAVQVDGLLTLLGEALVFVGSSTPLLSVSQQFTVLSAIEDLETVTQRVFTQCEACFFATLNSYLSSTGQPENEPGPMSSSAALPPSPRALLKKSVSGLTASSTFSMIGSEMLQSARVRSASGYGSAGSSGVLVPRPGGSEMNDASHARGWDWRAGLPDGAKGEDVLRILRLGLARGVSLGALGGV